MWVYLCVSVRIVYSRNVVLIRGFVMAGVHIKWVCLDSCSQMYRAFGKFMHPCWQIHSILSPNTYTNQCINMYILCGYGLLCVSLKCYFLNHVVAVVLCEAFTPKYHPFYLPVCFVINSFTKSEFCLLHVIHDNNDKIQYNSICIA